MIEINASELDWNLVNYSSTYNISERCKISFNPEMVKPTSSQARVSIRVTKGTIRQGHRLFGKNTSFKVTQKILKVYLDSINYWKPPQATEFSVFKTLI